MRVRLAFGWALGVLTLGRATLLACTCIWAGPFLIVSPQQDLIVRGKVLSYAGHGMDVEVYETLKGETKAAKVRVWGDSGMLCRSAVASFPLGTEWIFAVTNNMHTAEGGYEISACGEFAIKVAKETVSGRLSSGDMTKPGPVETMSLEELRKRLRRSAR